MRKSVRLITTGLLLGLTLAAGRSLAAPYGVEFPDSAGWVELLGRGDDGLYTKFGWNHCGDGGFDLDRASGVLTTSGEGGGLLWYAVSQFRDFVLELDYRCGSEHANSGVFLRIPYVPAVYNYIYDSFEVQILGSPRGLSTHSTAAVYDAVAPASEAALAAGQWNRLRITCRGVHLSVELNGVTVVDWSAEPRGKVATFWPEGYIGLQNHPEESYVQFRNIRLKQL